MVVAKRESVGLPPPSLTFPNQEWLQGSLLEASSRASRYQQNVVVCFVQPVGDFSPIDIFTCLQQGTIGDCFFWAKPSAHSAFIGCGSVATIETQGATRFMDAAASWQALLNHAVVYGVPPGTRARFPLLSGGFSFDALRSATPLWEGFPHGLFTLPQFLFLQDGDQAMFAINTLVQPDDDIEAHCIHLQTALSRLQTTLESYHIHTPYVDLSPYMTVRDLRPAHEWMGLVEHIVPQIQAGIYEKVVLARGVNVTLDARTQVTFDVGQVLTRLAQNYPGAYIFAIQRGDRCFTGATPECLVRVRDGHLSTMALAGTAPRGKNAQEDAKIGEALLASGKNQEEHYFVVAMLQKALQQFCSQVCLEDQRQLIKLQNVQHLMTSITGTLQAGYSVIEVVGNLHPTPAVGGLPRQVALEVIREQEDLDRGWYAGPIGWIDAGGDGEFAVALRSGLIHAQEATLFAGCGIVADSDPQSEYLESCLKLKVMLRGLGYEN